MASIGHIAVGLAAGRAWSTRVPSSQLRGCMVGLVALSMLPDADVIAFVLGIPYEAPWGHRGASHSVVFALVMGGLAAWLWPQGRRRMIWGMVVALVVVSHPLLDALTDGGLGVALAWPWSDARYFAGWRPLPVAPIGRRLLSEWGLRVMVTETLVFAPLLLYALWPRRRAPPPA